MSDFILSCCSTSDLDEKHYKDRDIRYVCFHYFLGDKEYSDDFGKSVPFKEFYARMAEGVMTRTSQVNEEEYTEYFESFLKAGKDVLHVTLSSGISGLVQLRLPRARRAGRQVPRAQAVRGGLARVRPRATVCSWISWLTCATRARR